MTLVRFRDRYGGLLAVCALLIVIAGCGQVAYLPGQDTVGRLRVGGSQVLLNGAPARDGQLVTKGDRLSTGPDSTAYVDFLSEGYIQLDQNTDPVFDLAWSGTRCFIRVMEYSRGQAYEEPGSQCFTRIRSGHGEWESQRARFNLQVDSDRSVMTVLEGNLELIQPQHIALARGEQMIVTRAGAQRARMLTEQELREVARWRFNLPQHPVGGAAQCSGACAD